MLGAKLPDMDKPGGGAVRFRRKLTCGDSVEDIVRKAANHAKESKLLDVDVGCCTKRARKEHHKRFRGVFWKLLKIKKSLLMISMENLDF